ncbi:MAG TPA: immunity 22 family protein [Devosiaceae bacterium]|jgi:hypothetical protein
MKKKVYPEAFRRELVDEALNRTPRGGFPELEKRHGLRAGTLFDWVEELGPPAPPAPFSAQHFWIGNTALSAKDFGRYFDHDPGYWQIEQDELGSAGPDVTGCEFCRDIGSRYLYDEDLMLVIHETDPMPVAKLVGLSALDSKASRAAIVEECERRGITAANAMFVYSDPTQEIPTEDKLYNGLAYIGLFSNK